MVLPRLRGRTARPVVLGMLSLGILGMALWALGSGAMGISARAVATALADGVLGRPLTGDAAVVWLLRLPRVLLALLVGAALGGGGAAMQGVFRNPLADPGLIGVSAGAALGAVGMIVLGSAVAAVLPWATGALGVALAAFAGGLLATWLVYRMGARHGGVATLLLAGVAINAMAMAGVGLMTYLANDQQLRSLTFWSLGSLGGATWSRLAVAAPLIVLPLALLPRSARALNALLLGEREAALLGYRPERLKAWLIALVALAVSAAVAMSGVIGFVGLVVPHLLRMVWGPDHRLLLPASALGGALLLLVADTLARTVVVPAELPIGVLTALVGGPFFLWLLLRTRALAGLS